LNQHRFKQVDVFTAKPFYGNPVAVVLEAESISDAAMQRIARWTNLSETTFVLPATTSAADYRLRIFTPASELPFAGHPSVGSAHAVLEAGLIATKQHIVQECGAGLLALEVEGTGANRQIFVTAPPAKSRALAAAQLPHLGAALGATLHVDAKPVAISVGPTWLVVEMPDAGAVSRLVPDMAQLASFSRAEQITGVTVFGRDDKGPDAINIRSFAPSEGVPEDPVCGSGNAAVGYYIATRPRHHELHSGYSASQGREIGRDGQVVVRFRGDRVQIGGHALTCLDGTLTTV
jgi:PhzF family phenazine biosynthesis protein